MCLPLVFEWEQLDCILSQRLLESFGWKLLSLLVLVAGFVCYLLFIMSNELFEVDQYQGIALVNSLGDYVEVGSIKLRPPRYELGNTILKLSNFDGNLIGIASRFVQADIQSPFSDLRW